MAIQILQFIIYLRDAIAGPRASEQLIAARKYVLSQRGEVLTEYRDGVKPSPVRSELHRALDHARQKDMTLVLPCFGHIAHEASPIALLRDSGVEFVALDFPTANQSSLPLLAAFHSHQAMTDDNNKATRTERATRAKKGPPKARRLTKPRFPPSLADRRKGAAVVSGRAQQEAERLGPRLRELRDEGFSLREIAARIVAEGETTRTGRPLSHTAVRRLLAAYEKARASEMRKNPP